jgi:hypothetical protein
LDGPGELWRQVSNAENWSYEGPSCLSAKQLLAIEPDEHASDDCQATDGQRDALLANSGSLKPDGLLDHLLPPSAFLALVVADLRQQPDDGVLVVHRRLPPPPYDWIKNPWPECNTN